MQSGFGKQMVEQKAHKAWSYQNFLGAVLSSLSDWERFSALYDISQYSPPPYKKTNNCSSNSCCYNELMRWCLIYSFIRRLLSILFCARLLGNSNQKSAWSHGNQTCGHKRRGEGERVGSLGLVDANHNT